MNRETRADGPASAADWGEFPRLLLAEVSLDTVLQRISALGVASVPGCSACGIVSVADGRRIGTRAASDGQADAIEAAQLAVGEGPVLEALRSAEPVVVDYRGDDHRWSSLARRARVEGIAASYTVPLRASGTLAGLISFYVATGGFGADRRHQADSYARQAAVPVANAVAFTRARDLAAQLNEALQSRDVIGQAKGIIMAVEGCGPDEAFDRLRLISQHDNVKLRDLAARVVETRALPDAQPRSS